MNAWAPRLQISLLHFDGKKYIYIFHKKNLTAAAVLLTRDTLYKQSSMFLGLEFKTFTTDLKLISCTI